MTHFTFLIIVNYLILLFIWLTVKHYRILSQLVKDSDINKDAMSIRFLEKIFYANPKRPDIRKQQKNVIKYIAIIGILFVINRHLFLTVLGFLTS